jgi:hypothetical protein
MINVSFRVNPDLAVSAARRLRRLRLRCLVFCSRGSSGGCGTWSRGGTCRGGRFFRVLLCGRGRSLGTGAWCRIGSASEGDGCKSGYDNESYEGAHARFVIKLTAFGKAFKNCQSRRRASRGSVRAGELPGPKGGASPGRKSTPQKNRQQEYNPVT